MDDRCHLPSCSAHYACRLRNKGLQVSPKVLFTSTQNWRATPTAPPAFNKEIIYDERPGGFKMPLLKTDGTPLRRKEYGERRAEVTAHLRNTRTATGD